MSKMIQIRNVPEKVHRALKMRAARAGMTLSDYLLREVTQVVARPELDDVLRRVQKRRAPELSLPPSAVLRSERESRS